MLDGAQRTGVASQPERSHMRSHGYSGEEARIAGWTQWRPLLIVSLLTVMLVAAGGAPSFAAGPVAIATGYTMQPRFGRDFDGDGLVDMRTDSAYVNPTTFGVVLDGCKSRGFRPTRGSSTPLAPINPNGGNAGGGLGDTGEDGIKTWDWTVTGGTGAGPPEKASAKTCDGAVVHLPQGSYEAELTVVTQLGRRAVSQRIGVVVRDIVIVSMGDSIASGEGAPDRWARWGAWPAGLQAGAQWAPRVSGRQCHRSSHSGPAQAAKQIEDDDAHTSVTFISVACSGAGIMAGRLGSYAGQDPTANDSVGPLEPQLTQVQRLLHGRPIDILMLSVGANDAVFGDVVRSCIFPDITPCDWDPTVTDEFARGVAALPALYKTLADRLGDELGVRRDQTIISDYPDPVRDENGRECNSLLFGETPLGNLVPDVANAGLSAQEIEWAGAVMIPRLNRAVYEGAVSNSWRFVGGMARAFRTGGFCAGDRRLVNSPADTAYRQAGKDGILHPNDAGHAIYGRRLAQVAERVALTHPPTFAIETSSVRVRELRDDADGHVDPGETVALSIPVRNTGDTTARNVSTEVRGDDGSTVPVVPFIHTLGDIDPGRVRDDPGDFIVRIGRQLGCGDAVRVNVTVRADAAAPFAQAITVPTGHPGDPVTARSTGSAVIDAASDAEPGLGPRPALGELQLAARRAKSDDEDGGGEGNSGNPDGDGSGGQAGGGAHHTDTSVPTDSETEPITLATPVVAGLEIRLGSLDVPAGALTVRLITPAKTVVLMRKIRARAFELGDVTFADDAAAILPLRGGGTLTGRYRPDGGLTTLDGTAGAGDWKVRVTNASVFTTGHLNGWDLTYRLPTCQVPPRS
jgi:lysophospholipase L1-like esterase